MALFGRTYKLIVDTLLVENLDISYSVDKSLQPEPNKAEIQVFNLNEEHRAQLEEKDDVQVELHVGYLENDTLSQIFRGRLRKSYSVFEPPDWVTTISTGDGDKQVQTSRVNKSFAPGTLFTSLMDTMAESLGVGLGNAKKQFQKGDFAGGVKSFINGAVLQGSTQKEMRRLLRSAGLEYSIQDEEIQVVKIGEALQGVAQVLSGDTGLIGSPQRGAKGELKLRILQTPDVYPGRKINVRSALEDGFFRVEKAQYKGSKSEQDWYIDIEAKELAL